MNFTFTEHLPNPASLYTDRSEEVSFLSDIQTSKWALQSSNPSDTCWQSGMKCFVDDLGWAS